MKLVKWVKLVSVHFFYIWTSKSGPNMSCFAHFDLEMCFAPQLSTSKSGLRPLVFDTFDLEMSFAPERRALFRHLNFQKWWGWVFDTFDLEMCLAPQPRALFRHLNFQKWSECEVFLAFLLTNVLRATTVCTFSTSQLPKAVSDRWFFTLLTWKCASHQNGVHFFISSWPAGSAPAALARLLFDPQEPQIIGKTQWIATSLPFRAPASSFFWLSPSLIFSLLDFSVLALPTSAFPSLNFVGSLTSKLPSIRPIF